MDVVRYGRSLIVPEWGVERQARLGAATVLIVGAGGLGCPCAMYLAGAGVGALVLVDADTVAESNLHRQVAHTTAGAAQGLAKAESLAAFCRALNPQVRAEAVVTRFAPDNALALVSRCSVAVDASDNVATRYLLNDACVACGVPLVSGSALGVQGQLSVYGRAAAPEAPCYRCVFPVPPPRAAVTSCSDGGILGPVTGVIGSLQAMEVMKLLGRSAPGGEESLAGRFLHYHAARASFRVAKLRTRNPACRACGDHVASQPLGSLDPDAYGPLDEGAAASCALSPPTTPFDVSCEAFHALLLDGSAQLSSALVVDVREPVQFAIGSLPGAVSFPLSKLQTLQRTTLRQQASMEGPDGEPGATEDLTAGVDEADLALMQRIRDASSVYLLCRRGIASAEAARILRGTFHLDHVYNIQGGVLEWHRQIDSSFPGNY